MATARKAIIVLIYILNMCSGQQFLEGFLKRHEKFVDNHFPKYSEIFKLESVSNLHRDRHNHHHPEKHRQLSTPKYEHSSTPIDLNNNPVPKPSIIMLPPVFDVRKLPDKINSTPPVEEQPKCPADTLGIKYRYYNQTKKCYQLGKSAPENPCGVNMQLYPFPHGSKIYGDCDCSIYAGCDYKPLVYFGEACFHLFDQGPCQPEEWLVLGKNNTPMCVKRECPQDSILKSGVCYQLGKQGFCKEGQLLQFAESGELICSDELIKAPGCGISKSVISGAPALPCRAGQKKTGSGSCGTLTNFE